MILSIVAVLSAVLLGAWILLTQPVGRFGGREAVAPPVDLARLEARVRRIVSFPSRSFGCPREMGQAADYIRRELWATGGEVTEQSFRVGEDTYRNLAVAFGPATADWVVVGAHYDAADEEPGADDNASGVAGLLELADHLGRSKLKRRVQLVAFALEEPPAFATEAMGSLVYARSLRQAGIQVRGMISLEMIGCFSDRPRSQDFPLPLLRLFYPSRGVFIAVVSRFRDIGLTRSVKRAMLRNTDLPVRSLNGPALIPGVALSDHLAFWENGYPAVMVTDTAFYRNPRYHTSKDTPETLDYVRMGKVVRGVYQAILELAQS